jgi:hypothetical protein
MPRFEGREIWRLHMYSEKRSYVAGMVLVIALAGIQGFAQTAARKAGIEIKPTQATDQDLNIRAYIELLRSDVRSQATAIVQDLMQLTESEGDKFWPIYREYELELSKQGDRKFELIKQYADKYESMSDEMADRLMLQVFELEQARLELKKRYYERIKTALSAKAAARFLQVNNQILMLIDLQIASSLPVVK